MRRWFKEYSREQQLLLALPYLKDVWRNAGEPARNAIRNLQQQLSAFLNVHCLNYQVTDYNDIWLRDTLPLWFCTATDDRWQGLLPGFDGWGGVQSQIAADQTLAHRLFGQRIMPATWRGEGGMFSHNGEWLLVGLRCLMQRNPELSETDLRGLITTQFAPLTPVFIDARLSADETGGHIDNMGLFIDDNTLLYSATDDVRHPDYAACQRLKEQLEQLPRTITKIPMPLPYPQLATADERASLLSVPGALQRTTAVKLLCSYVNVIAVGETIVLPGYAIDEDKEALQRLMQALPDKTLIQVPAREFVLGGGGLHCISHALPSVLALSGDADVRAL